jgi:hypothetical protein
LFLVSLCMYIALIINTSKKINAHKFYVL